MGGHTTQTPKQDLEANLRVLKMLHARCLALLALGCGAAAFNVGSPLRATKPALRVAAVPVMEEVVIEEEEAMSEEEYMAELEAEKAAVEAAKAGQTEPEEEQLLAPGEAERIKAEIKKRAPWMDIDPEVRESPTLCPARHLRDSARVHGARGTLS